MKTHSDNWSEVSLHDAHTNLIFDGNDRLEALKIHQEIPDDFLDEIAAIRNIQDHNALGNFALAARIPVVVVEHWMRQGFNIFDKNIGVGEIVKRLQSLDMDRLIATSKKRLH